MTALPPPAPSRPGLGHPAFAPYQALIDALDGLNAPAAPETLDRLTRRLGLTHARGRPLRFMAAGASLPARDYEAGIFETGWVPTRRDNWHDTLNALVWLRYPRFKSALNAAHIAALAAESATGRSRRRDALTLLDESGVWVAGEAPHLYAHIEAHAWMDVFWHQRQDTRRSLRFTVVGHALLEQLLAPYPGITGKCLWLGACGDPEAEACTRLADLASPRQLAPLPLLGIPGWDDNARPDYYANTAVFRPPRSPA